MIRATLMVCLTCLPTFGSAKSLWMPVHLTPADPPAQQILPKGLALPLTGIASDWNMFHEGYAEGPNAQLCRTLADLPPSGSTELEKALGQDPCAEG